MFDWMMFAVTIFGAFLGSSVAVAMKQEEERGAVKHKLYVGTVFGTLGTPAAFHWWDTVPLSVEMALAVSGFLGVLGYAVLKVGLSKKTELLAFKLLETFVTWRKGK